MTIPASDAAGSESAGGDMPLRGAGELAGPITRLREGKLTIVATMLVCLAIAGVYLLVATKVYTVTAVVMAERTRSAKADDVPLDIFLRSQKVLLTSPQIGGTQPLDVR